MLLLIIAVYVSIYSKILVIDEKGNKLFINKRELNLSWRYSELQKKII